MKKKNKENIHGKTCIIIKHLHSSCSSYSSNDKFLYLEIPIDDIDFSLIEGHKIMSSVKVPEVKFETISEIVETMSMLKVYLNSDKTYYNFSKRMLDGASEQEMHDLAKKYKIAGRWSEERPETLEMFNKKQNLIEIEHRKVNGYVIPRWDKDMDKSEYQGGFSDELFNTPYLKSYIHSGGCHGYIGSSSRTFRSDRLVEKILKDDAWSNKEISIFLCSKDGRHFSDGLEGDNSFKEKIDESVKSRIKDYTEKLKEEEWFKKELKKRD